jgi:hypothetical protein
VGAGQSGHVHAATEISHSTPAAAAPDSIAAADGSDDDDDDDLARAPPALTFDARRVAAAVSAAARGTTGKPRTLSTHIPIRSRTTSVEQSASSRRAGEAPPPGTNKQQQQQQQQHDADVFRTPSPLEDADSLEDSLNHFSIGDNDSDLGAVFGIKPSPPVNNDDDDDYDGGAMDSRVTGMEQYLREWRQDALNKAQYDAAIFIGDKLLALTGMGGGPCLVVCFRR